MPLLFAVTLFVSASLLFMVQPMVGKLVLPLLGGSPAVWNGCMVFFQALLLLGYLYADQLTKKADPKKQWIIHMGVLALPVGVFVLAVLFGARHTPIAVAESLAPSDESSPILSVLAILSIAIGVPFFVVSTTATLLQKWFTYTGHPSARDPYFLYAASNLGSLISLLGYPLFIEPNLSQGGQTWLFAAGFVALIGLIAFCGKAAVNPLGVPPAPSKQQSTPAAQAAKAAPAEPPPSLARMAKWTALAFVPSSLMLGVTFHMTTDIASIPLLWVGPLALYLVTFIVAFSNNKWVKAAGLLPLAPFGFFYVAVFKNEENSDDTSDEWYRILIGNLAPVVILLLVFLLISGVSPGVGLTLLLHLMTFYFAALMCHSELARDRPSPQYLTTYFLIMSFGGVLGGIFNSLVAPLVFPLAYEYPLALIIACLMVPRLLVNETTEVEKSETRKQVALALDIVIPVLVGLAFWQLRGLHGKEWFANIIVGIAKNLSISAETVRVVLVFALPVMICFFFVDRPLRFALCVAAILGQSKYNEDIRGILHTERSFFGILKIEEDTHYQRPVFKMDDGTVKVSGQIEYVRLVHGTTLHGTQVRKLENNAFDMFQCLTAANPWENLTVAGAVHTFDMRQEPLTYYHRTGPVGAMFSELTRTGRDREHVAMVGLGTGSVACYAQKGQKLTFYEIDPAVKRLVADTDKYFTYVSDARRRGAELDFRMGDARLKLKEDVDRKYALLLVDAFSSDAIPVHLLTIEAVQLYLNRIPENGILALHISNKFVRLEPVVAKIAEDLGLVALVWNDDAEGKPGKTASSWVVLARKKEYLGKLYSPLTELVGKYGAGAQVHQIVQVLYPDVKKGTDTPTPNTNLGDSMVTWLTTNRKDDPRAQEFARLLQRYGPFTTIMTVLQLETGHGFRPVNTLPNFDAWTDDYADVMRVMMIPQLQSLRRFFGLPTDEE